MNVRGATSSGTRGTLLHVGASAGLAVALTHFVMPPGGLSGRPPGGVVATLTAPEFLPLLLLAAAVVLVGSLRLRRSIGGDRTRILLESAVALMAIAPGHAIWFRCPVWLILAATAAIACWRIGNLEASEAASGSVAPSDRSGHGPRAAVAATIIAAGVLLTVVAPPTQGDEPHYLLVAHSLWQDGDLDLADDYGDREDLAFHRGAISPHYKPGLRNGSRYSMHGLGYPALLLPAYAVGRGLLDGGAAVLLARLLQVGLLAITAWLLVGWLSSHRLQRWAGGAVLLVLGLAPALFAPVSLFPETPAMLLSCAGFLAIRSRSAGRAPWGRVATGSPVILAGGCALAALPWLGVKYIPLAGAAALGGLIARGERPHLGRAALVFAPLMIALAGHAAYTWLLYGSTSPSAIYLGADPSFGRQPGYGADWMAYLADWPGACRTLVGYFFDQKEGLFLLAPQFLLVAGGIGWAWRRARWELLALMLMAAAHLAPYALSQQIGGQSPPARPLMAVLWIAALPLAAALRPGGGALLGLARGVLPALGITITAALALDPTLLPHDYPVTESWLLRDLSPQGVELWRAFPLWLNLRGHSQWLPTLLWTAGLVALLGGLYRSARSGSDRTAGRRREWRGAAAALAIVAALAAHSARLVVTERHVGAEIAPGVEAWVVRTVPETAWAEPGGVWVAPGRAREIVLVIDRERSALMDARLDLRLRTLVDTTVRLQGAGRRVRERVEAGPPVSLQMELGWAHPWRGRSAYRLILGSDEGIEPARLDGGGDWRPLGVFLQIASLETAAGESR